MPGGETAAAILFYIALALLVWGAVRKARATIERHAGGPLDNILLACGGAGLALAVAIFATGPRRLLPF